MENRQIERELERMNLLLLRASVNSQEEYDWVRAELAKLDAEEPASENQGHPITSIQEALRFLQERCGFIVVPSKILPGVWELESPEGIFCATFTQTEVIQYARGEYALHLIDEEKAAPEAIAINQGSPNALQQGKSLASERRRIP